MKKTNLVLLVIFLLPIVVLGLFATREKPQMFSDLSFAEAIAKAVEQDRILLVDVTAKWCPPCAKMERTTWVDPEVITWIKLNAIAIQVDVDAQQEIANELGVQALPTIIVFKGGKEAMRVVGYQDSEQLLDWLSK